MSELTGLLAIWYREFKVFTRERSRVISSVLNPLLFLIIFGAGLGSSVNIEGIRGTCFFKITSGKSSHTL